MRKAISIALIVSLVVNLCACGSEQAEPEVEEVPVVEEVQEVAPTEPVVQEVSAKNEKLSLTHQSHIIENEGLLYINEESNEITVNFNRKKLKDYTVKIDQPDVVDYVVNSNGNIVLKALRDGVSDVWCSAKLKL